MFVKIDYTSKAWKDKARACKEYYHFTCHACGTKYELWDHFKLEAHHPDKEAYQKGMSILARELVPLCGKYSKRKCHKKGYYSRSEIRRDRKAWWWMRLLGL